MLFHEIAHFMGLFHTTETDGTVSDPLNDTPKCLPQKDANHDGLVSVSECAGNGAENLMFWAGVGTDLTPGQRSVLRRSFVLY